jgi:hypothetical protein
MSSINEINDNLRNSPIAPRRTGPPQRIDITFPTEADRTDMRNELRAMNPNQSESSEDSSDDSSDDSLSEDSFHDAVEEHEDSNVEQDRFHDTRQSLSEMPENEDIQQGQVEDESNEEQVTDDSQIGVVDEQEPAMEDESDEEVTDNPPIAQQAEIDVRGAFEWFEDEKGRRIRRSLRIKENERIHGRVVYTKYL